MISALKNRGRGISREFQDSLELQATSYKLLHSKTLSPEDKDEGTW